MEKRVGLYHDLVCCPVMPGALAGIEKLPGTEELFPSRVVTGPF